MGWELATRHYKALIARATRSGRAAAALERRMRAASSYAQWRELAEQLDALEGNDRWRADPASPLYEGAALEACSRDLSEMLARVDVFRLMFRLRGGIARGRHGLLHPALFAHAHAGTKHAVERYNATVVRALEVCATSSKASVAGRGRGGGAGGGAPDASAGGGGAGAGAPQQQVEHVPTEVRLAFFNETRHAYGRTALLLWQRRVAWPPR